MFDTVPGGEPALAAFKEFHDQWGNHGFDRWAKEMRILAGVLGWAELLAIEDKALYRRRARALYKAVSAVRYARSRSEQLKKSPLIVYRCGDQDGPFGCGDAHRELDGVVLPTDHPFWLRYPIPSRWNCSCFAVGCRSDLAAVRLGGDPDKPLPDWTFVNDTATGRPTRTDWPFVHPHRGSTAAILCAIALGETDQF